MIGIVIPAHNEEASLEACLRAVRSASVHPGLMNEEVRVVVVLDSCSDGSAEIARSLEVDCFAIEARNVGLARAAGAAHLLEAGARWLAFTDADTIVSPAWLATQLSLGADVVCGTVSVEDWTIHDADGALLKKHFHASYNDQDQHRHIHGANLGVSASAYRQAGGFPALTCGEDVALVNTLIACGAHVSWSAAPRVTTTCRFSSRARGGFGDTLKTLLTENKDC